jgi:hypothetical protein
MGTTIETIRNLRNSAKENIIQYCIENNCIEEYDLFEKELFRKAEGDNLKLPSDFYIDFYNRSIALLKEGII